MALTSGRTGQLFGAKTVVTSRVVSRAIPEKKTPIIVPTPFSKLTKGKCYIKILQYLQPF